MQRKLYRSIADRRIAGVCGGLAEYLNVDALVVRLIFICLLLIGVFPILIIYLIMWVVVPENPVGQQKP